MPSKVQFSVRFWFAVIAVSVLLSVPAGGAGQFIQGVVGEKLVEADAVAGRGRLRLPELVAGNVVAVLQISSMLPAVLRKNHVRGAVELIDVSPIGRLLFFWPRLSVDSRLRDC